MKSKFFSLLAISIALVSCSDSDDAGKTQGIKDISLSRGETQILQSQTGFALNLFSNVLEIEDTQDNIAISPFGMYMDLALVANGAEGQSLEQILNALGHNNLDELNDLNKRLMKELPSIDKKTTLSVSNGIFIDKDRKLTGTYSAIVKEYYDATCRSIVAGTEQAKDEINNWCSSATRGKIKDFIESAEEVRTYNILNAAFFNGKWTDEFKKEDNTQSIFFNADGTQNHVTMMHKEASFNVCGVEGYTAIKMPYGRGNYEMIAILPDEGSDVKSVASSLCSANISAMDFVSHNVKLGFPKFSVSDELDTTTWEDALKNMGITDIFSEKSNLPNILESQNIVINKIKQKVCVDVDESGTTAAQVTSVSGDTMCPLPPSTLNLVFNKPFIYMIWESQTKTILFMGAIYKL